MITTIGAQRLCLFGVSIEGDRLHCGLGILGHYLPEKTLIELSGDRQWLHIPKELQRQEVPQLVEKVTFLVTPYAAIESGQFNQGLHLGGVP